MAPKGASVVVPAAMSLPRPADRRAATVFSSHRIDTTIFRSSDSTALPPGMKPWTAAEKAALLAECDRVDAVTQAHRKPSKADASAKANNYGWDEIVAAVMDPARRRSVAKDGRP